MGGTQSPSVRRQANTAGASVRREENIAMLEKLIDGPQRCRDGDVEAKESKTSEVSARVLSSVVSFGLPPSGHEHSRITFAFMRELAGGQHFRDKNVSLR